MAQAQVQTQDMGIASLRSGIRGRLIEPGDVDYERARRVYNGMIDRRPGWILQCTDVADVISGLKFARETGAVVAVRGGAHNGAGLAVCDDGIVIDLALMRGVRVDPRNRTVRVGAGCTWGEVDHATSPFGLAVPAGIVSTTGVAGLTLGGGHGYLTRKHGLTIDNLLSADMVLADGSIVTASEDENQDLFWAIRGGGGNFGIITSFLFRAHPVEHVYAGMTLWRADMAGDVLRYYRDICASAPEDLYGFFAFLNVAPADPFPMEVRGQTVCGIVWCYLGPMDQTNEIFRPIRLFGPPAFTMLGAMPYAALQSMFDAMYPPGLNWYWKGDFFKELPDDAINAHLKHGLNLPTGLSTMHLYPIDGAPGRIPSDQTAFYHRNARWSQVIVAVDSEPSTKEKMTSWARDYFEALHPYSTGGAYVNFMMEEGQDRVRATYRDNYDRLVEIKTRVDRGNLFCVNQNIRPTPPHSGFFTSSTE